MTEPQVQVFGPLQVSLGGRTARIGAGRQRAILGRLVLAGGKTIGADRLVEDVWEGAPPSHAPAVLQVQIHNLRRVLEPARRPRTAARILVSESSGYALRLGVASVDAWQFEAQMRDYEQRVHDPAERPRPAERYRILDGALNCWHGTAFESFSDAPWAAAEVARLTDLRVAAIEMRAEAALELGRLGEVVTELRRQVEEYPGREESVRLLASAQYRLGQQVEALATIRRTREFLRAEFGIDPGQRLTELESAILNQAVDPSRVADLPTGPIAISAPGAPAVEFGSGPTFYPRQRATIGAAAAEARTSGLRLTWLVGAAGTGKTTVVSSVVASLAAEGWGTAVGLCPEVDGAPPAWAWTEILGGLGGEPMRAEPPAAAVDPFTIAREVAARCRDLAEKAPVAIVLEDAHRADAATLQVLRQLANWLQWEPVLIVVTARGPELTPALRAAAAALADRMTERIELAGLDLAGTRAIAREAGLSGLDREVVHALHRRTGGNPLFVRELSKRIAMHGDSRTLPEHIRAVLVDRIEQLPTAVIAVLQHIAVWGRAIELDALAGLSGVAAEELVDLIDTAVAAGLVGFDRGDRVVLDQAMVRDAVYNSIPPLRRGRMHWNTMEFLEREIDIGASGRIGMLAHHAANGATRATAAQALGYVLAAAEESDIDPARTGAVELWRTAVELHELAGRTQPGALFEACCRYAGALAGVGRHAAMRVARRRALRLAIECGDRERMVTALTCGVAPTIWAAGDHCGVDERFQRELDAALAAERGPRRARLLIASVFEDGAAGAASYRRAREALDLAHGSGDAALVCAALNAVGYVLTGAAGLGDRRPVAGELLRVAQAAGLPDYQAVAHYLRFRAACRDIDLPAAARHAALALEAASAGAAGVLSDVLLAFAGATEVLRGDPDAAEQAYQRFEARMIASGTAELETVSLAGQLTVGWARADLSGLLDRLTSLYAIEPDRVAQLYAVALLHAGDEQGARAVFERHDTLPREFQPLMAALRAHVAVALGAVDVATGLLAALAPHTGTLIGFDSGAAVLGPMDDILGDLAEVTGDPSAAKRFRARAATLRRRVDEGLSALRSGADATDAVRVGN
ncbi:BTAD domain-containing putative transcriptional regulator [Nocardia sp. NPDC052566]|uniref:BTAD domain-containing putative transcriptional regulator n=1 Tax=Nocardia sp. NPDC052566 TaxID=3364330 RepID=UPI0037C85BE0